MLLLSVRMALPHYCQGGAVNGRIGAVNDVALTSPKGMATQRQAPASYGTRGTRGCYRIAIAPVAQPKNPPPFFLDFFSLSRRVRVDCHEPGSLAARPTVYEPIRTPGTSDGSAGHSGGCLWKSS